MKKKDVIEYFAALPEDPATIRNNRRGHAIGGVRKVASALNVSVQSIYQWPDELPDSVAYKIHYITQGKVKL